MKITEITIVYCTIVDCDNSSDHGRFIGSVCAPCYNYLTTGNGDKSQAYRNDHKGESNE